jgi:hypothetical protein
VLAFSSHPFFVLLSISLYTALTDGSPFEAFSHCAAHQYAPQEEYNDFHDGDTDEEIKMEAAPVAAPDLIVVSDDEEDLGEVNPEGGEPVDQPN